MDPQKDQLNLVDNSNDRAVAAFMKLATKVNWEITSRDDLGVHLRRRKRYGSGYFIWGTALAILGVGIFIWIVGLIDYLRSADEVLFIPYEDLKGEAAIRSADLLV